jgi:hypothetical protein
MDALGCISRRFWRRPPFCPRLHVELFDVIFETRYEGKGGEK